MYHLNASNVLLAKSADTLRGQFGTALGNSKSGRVTLGPMSLWLESQLSFLQQIELQCTLAARVIDDVGDAYIRSGYIKFRRKPIFDRTVGGGRWIIDFNSAVASIESIILGGRKLYCGFDFEQRDGYIDIYDSSVDISNITGAVCEGIAFRTYVQEYLFAAMFGYSDFSAGSRKLFVAIQKSLRDGFTKPILAEMVAASLGVEYVTQDATVVEVIERDGFSPVVLTTKERIRGVYNDTPTVSVGDKVQVGDMVFASVRIWDCNDPPPDYMTTLKIPRDLLNFRATGPVTISAAPSSPTFVEADAGDYHTRYPITASTVDQDRYFEAQDAFERESGHYLSRYLASSNVIPVAGLESKQYNWIEVLWATWLRFGAIVVRVSYPDSMPITDLQRHRLDQIRRAVPPWMILIIQAEVKPEHAC